MLCPALKLWKRSAISPASGSWFDVCLVRPVKLHGSVPRSRTTQLTFCRSAFVLLLCAFDPVFVLAAIVRQLFGDLVCSVWGVRVWIGSKLHDSSYPEFVHSDHRSSFPRPEGPRMS